MMRTMIQLNPGGWVYADVIKTVVCNGVVWTVCTPIDDPYGTMYTAHPDKIRYVNA